MPDQNPSSLSVDYSTLEADRQLWEDQSDLSIKTKAKPLAKPLARNTAAAPALSTVKKARPIGASPIG